MPFNPGACPQSHTGQGFSSCMFSCQRAKKLIVLGHFSFQFELWLFLIWSWSIPVGESEICCSARAFAVSKTAATGHSRHESAKCEQDSKFLEAPAVSSAENVRRTGLCAGSDFTISYRSCVFFLHSSGARITLEIYGELSERSKVRRSKSFDPQGSVGSNPTRSAILTKRYRCVWRKARRINRFRAFSGPDFFFQTIDANRCFRASAPIRTGYFPFLADTFSQRPF